MLSMIESTIGWSRSCSCCMSQLQYKSARKAIAARGWLREEPGDALLGPMEEPLLLDAVVQRLSKVGLSVEDLVTEASLPLWDVQTILERTRRQRLSIEI